jgi:geranylgeranyl diphosphate synthase type 3
LTIRQILLEPYEYLLQVPGKDVRAKLIEAFNQWLRIPDKELAQIKTIVTMLHNSSLLYVLSATE